MPCFRWSELRIFNCWPCNSNERNKVVIGNFFIRLMRILTFWCFVTRKPISIRREWKQRPTIAMIMIKKGNPFIWTNNDGDNDKNKIIHFVTQSKVAWLELSTLIKITKNKRLQNNQIKDALKLAKLSSKF